MSTQVQEIKEAARRLRANEVVGIPTETVYGLAASIDSPEGIRRIFEIKERPFFDPLIVHISSFDQIKDIAAYDANETTETLIKQFWPGPLSILFPKHAKLNTMITSGLDTVAIRMPQNQIARDIINATGTPLAAPSANKFSKTSPTRYAHVKESFPDIFVVDGGPSVVGIESTVVQAFEDGTIKILRPGIITEVDIRNCFSANVRIEKVSSLASPGNITHHYMPDVPLILCTHVDPYHAIERYAHDTNTFFHNPYELILDSDSRVAARQLYQNLRDIPKNCDILYFRLPHSKDEIWDSILDRLQRAASFVY